MFLGGGEDMDKFTHRSGRDECPEFPEFLFRNTIMLPKQSTGRGLLEKKSSFASGHSLTSLV